MLAEVGEERTFRAEGRRTGENVKAEVAALEFTLPDVAPLRKSNWLAIAAAHRQGVTVNEIP
ncbi:hypothetical protein D9M71_821120 [compost metagenome]